MLARNPLLLETEYTSASPQLSWEGQFVFDKRKFWDTLSHTFYQPGAVSCKMTSQARFALELVGSNGVHVQKQRTNAGLAGRNSLSTIRSIRSVFAFTAMVTTTATQLMSTSVTYHEVVNLYSLVRTGSWCFRARDSYRNRAASAYICREGIDFQGFRDAHLDGS